MTADLLLNAPLVRATRAGKKTQARSRITHIKDIGQLRHLGCNAHDQYEVITERKPLEVTRMNMAQVLEGCPYGKPGDIIKIREAAWMWCERMEVPVTGADTKRTQWIYEPLNRHESPLNSTLLNNGKSKLFGQLLT